MLVKAEGSIVHASFTDKAFVGVHDLFEEGDWVTLEGEPMHATGYAEWWPKLDNPNNLDGHQNCGALMNEGGLNDVMCYRKYAFFCEIPQIC